MDYDQFVFSQLFMIIFKVSTAHMTYDQVHPVLHKVWEHWLLTDALYGRADHEAGYDAMARYLQEHSSGIIMLLNK
ncbi:hypothetical protein Petty_8 [Acinetobacter phage Petty]|uniref:Uncharacterized protein n=1 Tax=Acinetobacter phage Petty TaxID=1406779 RepID=U5PVH4_9CAUD|nr:hypothetical protein Petty_8 [Acinetobacter phage Petty]AGY47980.1 hypothetical protein Petty_8 [Acinetobacter phage Petty]